MIGVEKTTAIVTEELQRLKAQIIANMRAANEVASGRTIQSLKVEKDADGQGVALWGRSPFGTLETGRKGGRIPRNFTAIIYEWMQNKGVHGTPMPYVRNGQHKYSSAQERGDWSMAAAVAHTIAISGTKLYRNGGRADIYSNVIPNTIERIDARISALFDAEVANVIKLNNNPTIIEGNN